MGILNSINRGRKAKTLQRLYDYWLDEDTLFTEDVPDGPRLNIQERSDSKTSEKYGFPDKQSLLVRRSRSMEPDSNSVWFSLPTRYVLQGIAVISLLLITLSVVSTILIMRSC